MKWYAPRQGDKRIVKRFAILPIDIDNEYRWLEWCEIEQMYTRCGWYNLRFIDKE